MKEGWRMVKFSEVAQVVGGSTPKTNVKSFWNGDNYWVTPAELKGEKYINKKMEFLLKCDIITMDGNYNVKKMEFGGYCNEILRKFYEKTV